MTTELAPATALVASSHQLDETSRVAGQGTDSLLTLAADLRSTAPCVRDAFQLGRGSRLMERAADALERLAELDPDVESVAGEN